MKKILLFGGSGFIGKHLIEELYRDYEITIISRNPKNLPIALLEKTKAEILDLSNPLALAPLFEKTDYIINLAGEKVDGKWTEAKKTAILESRLSVDKLIVAAFEKASKKPNVLDKLGLQFDEIRSHHRSDNGCLGHADFSRCNHLCGWESIYPALCVRRHLSQL